MSGASLAASCARRLWRLLRRVLYRVLRCGPLPQHVAFIMDGNRRYADRQHLGREKGHHYGYLKMVDALEWSLELGIQTVSLYAFSIDNFNRPATEVETLMSLAEDKLQELLTERNLVERHGIRIRCIGDLSLLPPAVQAAADRVMDATCQNSRGTLNICFSYTSRQEIAQAVCGVRRAVAAGQLQPGDVSVRHIEDRLYTQGCPPVDILIRTSGERRLSDFLLWQTGTAQLVFTDTLWPDFSFLDLLRALVAFQRAAPQLRALRAQAAAAVAAAAMVSAADSACQGPKPLEDGVDGKHAALEIDLPQCSIAPVTPDRVDYMSSHACYLRTKRSFGADPCTSVALS